MTRNRIVFVAASVLLSALSSAAHAQRRREPEPPGVEVRVTPEHGAHDAQAQSAPEPGDRYLYVFEMAPGAWPTAEVVADRRLLRFEVHPEGSRRRYRCRHPDAPRRVVDSRVMSIGAGAEHPTWREWIDLRMYCWGRALRALEDGASVEVSYGFRRRGRDRWVIRRPGGEDETRQLEGQAFEVPARADADAGTAGAEGDAGTQGGQQEQESPPVRVELRSRDVGSGGWVSFSVAVKANRGTQYVYLRDDLIGFIVDGPLGRAVCEVPRQPIVPIVDFYRRLRGRAAARTSISADRWCPEGTFDLAGVYDVTPVVDLVYDGERYDIDAATGRILGDPTPFRVRHDDRGYVEHVLDGQDGRDPQDGQDGQDAQDAQRDDS